MLDAPPQIGFHPPGELRPKPQVPERREIRSQEPLSLISFGLVPLTDGPISQRELVSSTRAEIVLNSNGIPIQSPDQFERLENEKRLADLNGRLTLDVDIPPVYYAEMDKGFGLPLALPQNILRWAAGLGFDNNRSDPNKVLTVDGKLSAMFDRSNRVYSPDSEKLKGLAIINEEGIRRLSMLGLMTKIVHAANGIPQVRTNIPNCEVTVKLDGKNLPHTLDGRIVDGFQYSLTGVKAVAIDGQIVELDDLKGVKDPEDGITQASQIVHDLIAKHIDERPKVIQGAQAAAKIFSNVSSSIVI